MEPAIDAATIPHLPRPLTLRNHVILECIKRTNVVPRVFQVDFALAIYENQDVVCVAGTGSGKSLAFIIIHFFCPDVITWIISPLNVIENQMATNYAKYGLKAVAVNASTITPTLIRDIKKGRYQVIILSPESYKDADKLRQCLLSEKLAGEKHVTIVDEAHCIATWGNSGFRKDFERIGDMRVFMRNPDNALMCAATATLASCAKPGIIKSLHIKPDYLDINLGCWRPNLRYGVRLMNGGQKSYYEVARLFDPSIAIQDTPQAMVFVEDCQTGHCVADALRTHFNLSGQLASDSIPVYHSNLDDLTKRRTERRFKQGKARILVSTEALTMGADFPDVQLVINYLSPTLVDIWLQRAGRNGRSGLQVGLCLLLVTKGIVTNALNICKEAGLSFDPVIRNLKVEDGEDEEDELTREEQPKQSGKRPGDLKRTMGLEMAEYIATGISGGCLTELTDRIFKNPPHTPCYEAGSCENCVKSRQEQEPDSHRADREATRPQDPSVEEKNSDRPRKVPKPRNITRPVQEQRRFLAGILAWCHQKLLDLLEVHDTSLDEIMTEKEAVRISKHLVKAPEDFDKPEIKWPGLSNWRLELVTVLWDLQRAEDLRTEEAARLKAEEQEQARLERQRIANERKQTEAAKASRPKVKATQCAPQAMPTQTAGSSSVASGPSYENFWKGSSWLSNQTPRQNERTVIAEHGLPSPISPNTPLLLLPSVPKPNSAHTPSSTSRSRANTTCSQPPSQSQHPRPVERVLLGPNGSIMPLSSTSSAPAEPFTSVCSFQST
ncbi:hypothetical protein FRC06_002812 [Ceratobasidium sp. 370]|nr:hypothetical protein FRC06_002812 [Ceratobasidium sp. 370]